VARAIVKGIHSRLVAPDVGTERPAIAPRDRRRAVDPEAYMEYLRGRHAWTKRTPAALRQAIAYYERAIERDPTYSRAYAGIAECHGVLGYIGATKPRNAFPSATAAARRALELDSSNGSAYIALAYVATHYRWELNRAAETFEQGLRLEPNDLNGRHWYALLLTSQGERDAAIQQMHIAEELDPLSTIARVATGLVLHFFGEFEAAAAECRDALDLDPDSVVARWILAKALLGQGKASAARDLLQPLVGESPWTPPLGDYGRALALSGHSEEARAVLTTLASSTAYVRPYDLALVHMGLHEHDAALDSLETAFAEGGNWLNYLRLDPAFADLRSHPRFSTLLQRVSGGLGNRS
jgi:tetratricopeptide (TPR) repeat protein